MNTANYKEFTNKNYISEENEIYSLGDIVVDRFGNIGVIIQTFSTDQIRTDNFGLCSVYDVRPATMYEIQTKRPSVWFC